MKYSYQLIIVLVLNFSLSVMGQSQALNSNIYQKNIKFTALVDVEEAKSKFINEFDLGESNTFIETSTNTDKKGVTHKKFQQYYKGVKVEYGTMIVHSKNGKVTSINGELYNPRGLNLTANISGSAALRNARSHVGAQSYLWDNAEAAKSMEYKKPEGELLIFPIIDNGNYTLELAYKFDIYATAPISRSDVYVSANNGDFLFNSPIIKHCHDSNILEPQFRSVKTDNSLSTSLSSASAYTRYSGLQNIETRAEVNGTFTLNDDIRGIHTYNAENSPVDGTYQFTTIDFVDDDNNWTAAEYDNVKRDNGALDAHWGAMNVYDFWANLGRNSIDGAGMDIISYVHVDTDYFNAFWNGSVMSYGDGTPDPLTSIDIVSHEMAHGVTSWTANLVYARESGAMNEGFSDIFGAAVEFYAKGTGTDLNPNPETWLLAEEFWPGGYLRSMSDPKSKGDPDTYNGLNYIDASSNCTPEYGPGGNDGCGVHTNSGVLNHWFYILVAGKTGINDAGDNYNVTGIGMAKAQEIAYLTLRDYLTPNSTFIDARNLAIEVASSLYGSNSAERKATQDAFYAVNLGDEFIPYATDLNLVEFSELVDITCGQDVIPKILVRNSGASNVINSIVINYSVDGVAKSPLTWNGALAVDAETEITLPAISESRIKSYNLVVESVVVNDGDSSNNNLSATFRVNRADSTPSQVNTFENFLIDYWLAYNEGGGSNLWIIGTPNKTNLNSVTSGNAAYVTGTTSNYPNNTKSYLVSPCYDLTGFTAPKMKFNMAFQLQNNFDLLYVEYSTDLENWTILGSAADLNWYNSSFIFESGEISNSCPNCVGAQWTGSSNTLKEYSYDLSAFTSESNINFRFVFHSDESGNDEGVVIDDFVIDENPTLAVDNYDYFDQSILIYPNPSESTFNLSWDNGYDDVIIEIFDITGRMILRKYISKENKSFVLEMSNYSKGLYLAKIKLKNVSVMKKLILN